MIQASELRGLGALRGFSAADVDLLLTVAQARVVPAGEILYTQGERARACFLLVRGVMEVERQGPAGARVVATLRPGTFVGQIALLDHGRRTATVRAAADCEGLELGAEAVEPLLTGSASLALAFQEQLAVAGIRQFRQAMARLAALPPPRAASAAARQRELGTVQAYLTELGASFDELDDVQVVFDTTRHRGHPR